MTRFILRRIVSMVFVMFAITVIVFAIFFVTPVDPAAQIAGRNASPEILAQVRASFGLDRPLPVQYLLMMKGLFVTGDLTSFVNRGAKVVPEIASAAPVTLSLVGGAAVIWMVAAIFLGAIGGGSRGRLSGPFIMLISVLGISIPSFWLGEVVNLLTQSELHSTLFRWVPPLGYVPLTKSPGGWALHLLFPWLTLAALYAGIYSRVLRAELIEARDAEYVRTARAKGLSERRILLKHSLRCSIVPVVELFGLDFGVLVGGAALLTEVVFGLPGIGVLTYNALQNVDLPVLMGTVIYTSIFVVLTNAVVDVVHGRLDPRVRARRS